MNDGLHSGHKLTLVSAPAGFGKTTLVSEWVAACEQPIAWLSLDEGDNDPTHFLIYLITALQTLALRNPQGESEVEEIAANIGEGILGALQSPQPPSTESILTALLNEITAIPDNFVLVLDDYHVIDAKAVDDALTFLLERLPPQMHMVIATREDPHLPLARLRARGQLTELRAADLRFTPAEAADFLNQVMGLGLSAEDITALEARTEGWIAGLQLAAISMQGHKDAAGFIKSFTGSHRFVLDYLVEEVLGQQPESIQAFLLRTSILDRMCGPLCDAVLCDPSVSGQETLKRIEQANLFIVPLDNERRWYRYHHLFAELLRQRLRQGPLDAAELHRRASQWYEDNDLEIEAFHHAATANDIERAGRLLDGRGIPLYLRGGLLPALKWLRSLPTADLDARPKLWVMWASALLVGGNTSAVEGKLQAAEAALQGAAPDDTTRDLHGQIAAARAVLGLRQPQTETIIAESRRALELLHPDNLSSRFRAHLALGNGYEFRGERAAARQAYSEALAIAEASGNILHTSVATSSLGSIQELENQLYQAAETYRRSLQFLGDQQPPVIGYAHLGLARILYEWDDLEAAHEHAQQGLQLGRQYDPENDIFVICDLVFSRLKLARGDVEAAAALLAEADQAAHQMNFTLRLPEIAAARVRMLLQQGNLAEAAALARSNEIPMSQARVHLAQGDPAAALAVLAPFRQQMETKGWQDEQLKALVLEAAALRADGKKDEALQVLGEALRLAEPGGFIRLFIDEGIPMAQLLSEAAAQGIMPDYTRKLLAAFEGGNRKSEEGSTPPAAQPLIEPLSERELEVLRLIAEGLSNQEISARLFLALSTVKGHNRVIFSKLQVQRRTEAVARARELGLLQPK